MTTQQEETEISGVNLNGVVTEIPFQTFKKIPRWSRDIVITEKLDGTNGVIFISDDLETFKVGSRSQWLYPGKKDNFGFAAWAILHAEDLLSLGPGYHYGEWWGLGINRGYGLKEKRWSLFNTSRWKGPGMETKPDWEGKVFKQPLCTFNVPVLYDGPMSDLAVQDCLAALSMHGSFAAPGFQDPEGIVVYHTQGNVYFKKTLVNDEKPKGVQE